MQKSGWAGPPFIKRDKRRTVEWDLLGKNVWNISYLDLENKTPIKDL
jgi:hypothetical protein